MKYDCVFRLNQAGISVDDAFALRRISMTLHSWHELECGDGNDYDGSWAIVRGAIRRLDKIMARYPGFQRYIQTDPRGCALYILTPERLERYAGQPVDSIYNHGIAVFK